MIDVGVVPQFQFIDRVFFLVVNRDRYPQLLFSAWVSECCSTLTRSSMCLGTRLGCSMEACERISHIFFVLHALFAWNLDVISRALCIWQLLAPGVPTLHGDFWMNFLHFPREKVDSDHLGVHTWKFEHYFYEQYLAVSACVSLRCFWKNFTYFLRVGVPASLRSSHLGLWTLFPFAVIWRWDGVFGGSDAFFTLLQVVWS